ncbi:hypothetical protein [Myxosarcina sp. GI1]|uniref:hypothetical protein n=1 Tax=Myxosarcina sp. GI1 TaxID=1541065 RepID=UPI00056476C3|nr:hypothetical protein [Myxosarcina sp. GI1]
MIQDTFLKAVIRINLLEVKDDTLLETYRLLGDYLDLIENESSKPSINQVENGLSLPYMIYLKTLEVLTNEQIDRFNEALIDRGIPF